VDGLNRSFIGGITLNLTENSDSILEGAHLFFRHEEDATPKSTLISPESAMLTDEGSAYTPRLQENFNACICLIENTSLSQLPLPQVICLREKGRSTTQWFIAY
jgi:hypothetical protein